MTKPTGGFIRMQLLLTSLDMKTFEQCCDEMANKLGIDQLLQFADLLSEREFYKQAAQLWREEGIKEAIALCKEKVIEGLFKEETEQEITEKLKA